MKKYIYTGLLLGTIMLAGCSVKEDSKEQVTEDTTNGQAVKVEDLSVSDKEIVAVTETPLHLTQEQKENFYKRYMEIVDEVNIEYEKDFELEPFDEFLRNEEWFIEPKEFREMATDMAIAKFTSEDFSGDTVE